MINTATKSVLHMLRLSVLMIIVTAFVVSLYSPIIMTANPNFPVHLTLEDTLIPAIMVALATALVTGTSYVLYVGWLRNQIHQHRPEF